MHERIDTCMLGYKGSAVSLVTTTAFLACHQLCRFKEEAGDKVRCECGAPNCKGSLN